MNTLHMLLRCFALLMAAGDADQPTLDNGTLRIGVDLKHGGAISYLAPSQDHARNLINTHDPGRYIQASFYSGPHPFGSPHPNWKNWPWNPITAGDAYHHGSQVLDHRIESGTLYVKTRPLHWALDNVPADCIFENWITLEGNTVHLKYRLTSDRRDQTAYVAMGQELPAVYTNGPLHRLFTYTGDAPFTSAPLQQITASHPPRWKHWTATENWAALVDDQDWGVGVYHPHVFDFTGGFAGKPGSGGASDNPTGYIAPLRKEHLDHNIVYDYQATLIVGTLAEIRKYVYDRRPAPQLQFDFARDRRHWTRKNCSDAGLPHRGRWSLELAANDPQLLSPALFFPAAQLRHLKIQAAYHDSSPSKARIYFNKPGQADFPEEQSVEWLLKPDGSAAEYRIDMGACPLWTGRITQLRIDPAPEGLPGRRLDLIRIELEP